MVKKFKANSWINYLMGYIVGTLFFVIWSSKGDQLSLIRIGIDIVLCAFNGYMLYKFFDARRTIKNYKEFMKQ